MLVSRRPGNGRLPTMACRLLSPATWTSTTLYHSRRYVPLCFPCTLRTALTFLQAWVSGARSWTAAQRQAFANDVTRPQLVAVTDNLNQAKSDTGAYSSGRVIDFSLTINRRPRQLDAAARELQVHLCARLGARQALL